VTLRAHLTHPVLLALVAACALACDPDGPKTDSQTNWLKSCQIDAQCEDGLSCFCGACTRICEASDSCAGLEGSECVPSSDKGSVAVCGGEPSSSAGLCLPRCEEGACAPGQMCVAGVCSPVPTTNARVVIDVSARHQALVGLGATVGYAEDEIVSHPQKAALYDAMFAELGIDLLRLRVRNASGAGMLGAASEILTEAEQGLGRSPTLLVTSWSPPAALKQSGATSCQGNADTCTLARNSAGEFDYAGFAAYWRSSLDDYEKAGIFPDYIGIQNNPDWVPAASEVGEACKFLPVEGSAQVTVDGVEVEVEYPGYKEALAAVQDALEGLASPPKIMAPEVSGASVVGDYSAVLDLSSVEAISHHLYGTDPSNLNPAEFEDLNALGASYRKPLFQTEMQADGFGTAVLLHYTLAVEGAAVYAQTSLASAASGPFANPKALFGFEADTFTRQEPYYAFQHYSLYTDPGFVRVGATSTTPDLLASAWLSPDEGALTIVLVNAGRSALDVELDLGSTSPRASKVTRTVFDGVERSAELGRLSEASVVDVPSRAMVTIALEY
jgi:glucuronoarabinoxylan endo-1,4-beta-xylanase